ncbi:MAG: hypothetical protein KKC84_03785, partial [Candidatus Omnitrophica bacterium]|nr:hypothetical protein [Candidatus Omnitrophota bacterium]
MNNKGIAMIFGFIIIAILTILASAIISRSVNEGSIAKRYLESTQAFWLAEAGVQQAVSVLRN